MAQAQKHPHTTAGQCLPGQPGPDTTVAVGRPQLSFWEMPEGSTEVRLVDTVTGLTAAAELLPMCDACGIDAGGCDQSMRLSCGHCVHVTSCCHLLQAECLRANDQAAQDGESRIRTAPGATWQCPIALMASQLRVFPDARNLLT